MIKYFKCPSADPCSLQLHHASAFADYYSEQKKLEAKELRREAQAKQTEFDVAAKLVAENGLVKTLGMMQF